MKKQPIPLPNRINTYLLFLIFPINFDLDVSIFDVQLPAYSASKLVRQLDPKTAPILGDLVLAKILGSRVPVGIIKQVVEAR